MKRSLWYGLGLILVLIVFFGISYFNGAFTGRIVYENNSEVPVAATQIDTTPTTGENYVKIVNYAYIPIELRISAGETVTWENRDYAKHTVTGEDLLELDSPLFGMNERYSFTFNTPGIYRYYCKPHPYMKGTIIVE